MRTFILWLQMLPRILELITVIEDQIPLPSAGKEKLDLLLDLVKTIYDSVTELHKDFTLEKVLSLIPAFVKIFVTLKNRLGLFKHAGVPAVPIS